MQLYRQELFFNNCKPASSNSRKTDSKNKCWRYIHQP